MPVTTDIAKSYRAPRQVMRKLIALGPREDRALAFLMGACVLFFVSYWPILARQAHINQEPLNPLLGGALMAWVFAAPLLFYVVALILHWVLRAFRGRGSSYGTRLALFWGLLASSPLLLLHGLVSGFVGPGVQQQLVGLLWFAAFCVITVAGLRVVHGKEAEAA